MTISSLLAGIRPAAHPPVADSSPRCDAAPADAVARLSGADRVLKRMGRPYRVEEYRGILSRIRERLPNACLGTDVIVGFPGESEDDFAESCAESVQTILTFNDLATGCSESAPIVVRAPPCGRRERQ